MAFESEISAVLRTQPKIRLAVLFGSLGRTRGRADSDLDIAVAAAQPFTAEEKIELIQNLAAAFGRPVDVVDLQAATGPILAQALTTGRVVHCTDHTLYAELIKRVLFDEADMRPYRDRILAERRRAWIKT